MDKQGIVQRTGCPYRLYIEMRKSEFYSKEGNVKGLRYIVICLLFSFLFVGCSNHVDGTYETSLESTTEREVLELPNDEVSVADKYENRHQIATVLNIESDSQKIDDILLAINDVGAGTITNVSLSKDENSEYELFFKGEDGSNYRILLSRTYSFVALQNVDTGEWLIKSTK